MKFIVSVLAITALGFGLLGCPGGGGGTAAFAVSTTAADFGVVGNNYTSTLSATGGTPPFTWADAANDLLLLGLALNPATGVISGIPTATTANAFTATIQVTDSAGQTANGSVTLRLRPRTDRASVDVTGNAVSGSSNTEPSISKTNGRFIAFSSPATLVPGVTGNQVYVHDRQTGQATLISQNDLGNPASAGSSNTSPTISGDGRFVAFVSNATNLVGNFGQQIYLRDLIGGTTTLISQDGLGNPASAGSSNTSPTISGDGRYVAFSSNAINLVLTVSGQQVYRHDTQTGLNGQNVTCSLDSSDTPGSSGGSSAPSITNDGSFVAFSSTAPLISPAAASDVYVRAVP
jgi:Tol biopolymer transport system component